MAFTDRVGEGDFDLNLARVDVPGRQYNSAVSALVAENWRRVLTDFAPDDALCDMVQVHGSAVGYIAEKRSGTFQEPCDGIVSDQAGVTLAVRVADCVPILLADITRGIIAAVHAGRVGMVTGVVEATVGLMQERRAGDLQAWIGPAICGSCYEVPQELQSAVVSRVPASRATTAWGTPGLDLVSGVRSQLDSLGVKEVEVVPMCTHETATLHSYRRDGIDSGRQVGLIRWSPR